MPSEISQRNTLAQELKTLQAKQTKLQKRMDDRDWKNSAQKRQLIQQLVSVDKRLSEIGANSAVQAGIDEANRR